MNVYDGTKETAWWLEFTCQSCIYGETDCPYMEKSGKYRACSLYQERELE
jgi:hypothetical protein